VPLEGFAFLEEIENNPEFKDKIVTDSMLPDQTAKEIVEDILFEHGLIKRAIKGKEETPTLSKLLNINASYEIRESFKDLGFDSIVYSQGNTVDDQMEDLGMREGFFAGGLISKLSRRITNLPFKQTRKQLDAGLKTQTSRNYAAGKQGDYFIEGDYIYVLTEDPYEKPTTKILKEDFKAEGYNSEKELKDIFSKFKYDQKDTMFVHKFERYRKTRKAAGKKAVVFDNNQYKPVQKVKPEEADPRTLYIFADNATKKYKKGSIADRASKMPNGFGVTVSRADVSNFKNAKVTDYFRDANYVTEGTMLRGKDLLVSENLKFIHRDIKKIIEAYASGNFDSIQVSPDFYRAFKTGYSPLTAGIVRGKINQVKKLEESKPSYVSKSYPRILKDIIGIQAKPVSKRVYLESSKSGKSWTVIDPKKDVLYDAQQKPYQMIEQYFDPKKADLWKKETPAFVPGTTIPSKKGVTQSGLERYDIDKRPRKGMYDQDLELKEMQRELEFDNPYLAAKSRIKMYTDTAKNEYNPDMADQIIAEYFPGADSVDDILKLDDTTISAFGERLKQIGGEGKLSSSKRKQQFNEVLKYIREQQRQKKAEGGEIKEIEVKAYKRTGQRGRPAYEYAIEMLGEDELDKLFLKEIAFVESKWANDEGTFRPNNRSAYQITPVRFEEFKETNTPESKRGRGLRAYTKKIKDRWNIDLSNIEYDDLNDPVIGTVVTRALWKLSPEAIGKTPKERARQWKSFWNTEHKDAKGTVEKYLSDVSAMENYPVKRDLLGSLLNKKK